MSIVEHLAPTDAQRTALRDRGIYTVEDLLRAVAGNNGATGDVFTVELRAVIEVCNSSLAGLRVYRRHLMSDPQVSIHGSRHSERVTFHRAAPSYADTVMEEDLVPPEWYCPLTHEVFSDPVVLEDGHTYENRAIRDWLQRSRTSPMTGESLSTNPRIVTNRVVRDWIGRLS